MIFQTAPEMLQGNMCGVKDTQIHPGNYVWQSHLELPRDTQSCVGVAYMLWESGNYLKQPGPIWLFLMMPLPYRLGSSMV